MNNHRKLTGIGKAKRVMAGKHKPAAIRDEWPRMRDTGRTGKSRYVVDFRPEIKGAGEREYFEFKQDALNRAEERANERHSKGSEAIAFSTELRVEAQECAAMLQPFGAKLRDAVIHYIEWLKRERQRKESKLVAECVEEFLAECESDVVNLRFAESSMRAIRHRLKRFKERFGERPIMAMTRLEIDGYLRSLKITDPGEIKARLRNVRVVGDMPNELDVSERTKTNVRAPLSKFFNFCLSKDWIEVNPCTAISIKVADSQKHIMSVADATELMEAAQRSTRADLTVSYAAVCLFAGLRPGEAEQLDWKNIDFETSSIEVLPHTSKTRDHRFVQMEANLIEFLRPHAQKSGNIIGGLSVALWRGAWDEVRAVAGYVAKQNEDGTTTEATKEWHHDMMRHSYASYWLAVHKNRPQLAEQMGNSVDVIKKHYRRPILEAAARKYWEILPE